MATTRPDSYVLLLTRVKSTLNQKIRMDQSFLDLITKIKADPNYSTAATDLEKSNFDELNTLLQSVIQTLNTIVWE